MIINGKNIAYVQTSADKQDLNNQKLTILDYAQKNKFTVNEFIDVKTSSTRFTTARKLDVLNAALSPGDTLIVSEISRLSRSLGGFVVMVNHFLNKGIVFKAIKEKLIVDKNNRNDLRTIAMLDLFPLMAELERDMVSERTKMALARARAEGKRLGRPKGLGKSKLDEHKDDIIGLMKKRVSKAAIARIYDVHPETVRKWVRTRKIKVS